MTIGMIYSICMNIYAKTNCLVISDDTLHILYNGPYIDMPLKLKSSSPWRFIIDKDAVKFYL